jgi:hypothetical protein
MTVQLFDHKWLFKVRRDLTAFRCTLLVFMPLQLPDMQVTWSSLLTMKQLKARPHT